VGVEDGMMCHATLRCHTHGNSVERMW